MKIFLLRNILFFPKYIYIYMYLHFIYAFTFYICIFSVRIFYEKSGESNVRSVALSMPRNVCSWRFLSRICTCGPDFRIVSVRLKICVWL